MNIRRDKRDDIFSRLVRERANWTCERCGKHYPPGQTQGLHCSHFYSRRYRATRWHPMNAAAHCFACHEYLGGNPVEFALWIDRHIGSVAAAKLGMLAHSTAKWTKVDLQEIYLRMCYEHKRMMELRQGGHQGRIEFAVHVGGDNGIEHSTPVAPEKRRRRR